jgi:hypothetical protein
MASVDGTAKSKVVLGFWLALGFAIFAYILSMVKKVSAKAKTDLPTAAKRDYTN